MKKRTSAKMKNLSVLLALVMLIAAVFPNYALAADSPNDGIDLYSTLTDEDLSINAEVATCVAELFVRDMIATGTTVWNESTEPVNTVTMYDETGDTPTAYSVELTKGYVVVSAFVDMPSIILEWADESAPLYKEEGIQAHTYSFNSSDTKIVYLGAYGYYYDNGANELLTLDGQSVERDVLTNNLVNLRDTNSISDEMYTQIFQENQSILPCGSTLPPPDSGEGAIITDVLKYAKNAYGGEWRSKPNDWKNDWERYKINMMSKNSTVGYFNACFLYAISNSLKLFGTRYGHAQTANLTAAQIFADIARSDAAEDYYKNIDDYFGGVVEDNYYKFATAAFAQFGTRIKMSQNSKRINTTNVISTIDQSDRLMLINLYEDTERYNPYGRHVAIGYAYCRIIPKDSAYPVKTFLKILDGHTTSDRYLHVNLLETSTFYEISRT